MGAISGLVDVTVESNIYTLISAIECKWAVHSIFVVLMVGTEHYHVTDKTHLSMNNLAAVLSNKVPPKLKSLFKPLDRGLWIAIPQGWEKL